MGKTLELVMRAYSGSSWESSLIRGESVPFEVRASSDGLAAELVGLQPFSVFPVPEPGALFLLGFGSAALFLTWKSKSHVTINPA
jgi:hypothetical protein